MSLCTVSELKAALGSGSLYADATLQEVCDATDVILLPMLTTTHVTATCAACQQAALMLALDIWQARQAVGQGTIGIDGTPMPYRLGNSLLGKIRGVIAHALAPETLVG